MSAIGKGDFVEFLGPPEGYVSSGLVTPWRPGVGSMHRVTAVGMKCRDGAGQVWESIQTNTMPVGPHGRQLSAPVACFKPISGGQPGMFSHLLKRPVDAPREPVDA